MKYDYEGTLYDLTFSDDATEPLLYDKGLIIGTFSMGVSSSLLNVFFDKMRQETAIPIDFRLFGGRYFVLVLDPEAAGLGEAWKMYRPYFGALVKDYLRKEFSGESPTYNRTLKNSALKGYDEIQTTLDSL